jgi:hypothetical protein
MHCAFPYFNHDKLTQLLNLVLIIFARRCSIYFLALIIYSNELLCNIHTPISTLLPESKFRAARVRFYHALFINNFWLAIVTLHSRGLKNCMLKTFASKVFTQVAVFHRSQHRGQVSRSVMSTK